MTERSEIITRHNSRLDKQPDASGGEASIVLYLDLMKRVLTDSIFIDDPLAYFVPYRDEHGSRSGKELQ
jgi:hypothetical protein